MNLLFAPLYYLGDFYFRMNYLQMNHYLRNFFTIGFVGKKIFPHE